MARTGSNYLNNLRDFIEEYELLEADGELI